MKLKRKTVKTYYEVLSVPPAVSAVDLREAYMRLAKEYHPDTETGKLFPGRFAEITEAYGVLRNPERRRAYDITVKSALKQCPKCGGEGKTWRVKGFTKKVATQCAECGGTGRVNDGD